jgi:hypothetical protein
MQLVAGWERTAAKVEAGLQIGEGPAAGALVWIRPAHKAMEQLPTRA